MVKFWNLRKPAGLFRGSQVGRLEYQLRNIKQEKFQRRADHNSQRRTLPYTIFLLSGENLFLKKLMLCPVKNRAIILIYISLGK